MKATEIIKEIMSIDNVKQTDLQQLLGFKTQARISTLLKSDIRVSTLVRICDVLGYDVIIKGKNKEWIVNEQ